MKKTLTKSSTASKSAASKKQTVLSITQKVSPALPKQVPILKQVPSAVSASSIVIASPEIPPTPLPSQVQAPSEVLVSPILIPSPEIPPTPVPSQVEAPSAVSASTVLDNNITSSKIVPPSEPSASSPIMQSSEIVASPVIVPEPVHVASDTPVGSGETTDTLATVHSTPSPVQQVQANQSSPEGTNTNRSYRAVVEKYSIGVHKVKRSQIHLGPNSRVVTTAGVMKVVNSFRAQGYIEGVNTPVVVFNTQDARFQDIHKVRKSAALIEEIVSTGTMLCDAGQHRELAFRYLERPENMLPTDAPVPTIQEIEILVNVKDDYDFFVIGKKHNKITQAQNNEHIVDHIRQVGRMWEKVQAQGGKRKNVVMADAYRLNCAEFGPEDMGSTKFTVYFSFYQTLTQAFMKNLEIITTNVGADVMPVSAIEVLVKFVKNKEMKGRPLLSAQLQLESLNFFERNYKQCKDSRLSSKLYESVVLPYLVMILSMQQTAIGLLPDDEGQYEMPEFVSKFFMKHLHGLEAGANGLAFAQDFYHTHLTLWQESKGYLPSELKKFFTSMHTNTSHTATTEVTPTLEGSFSTCKKRKTGTEPLSPQRKSCRLQKKVDYARMEAGEVSDDEVPVESSPETESEPENTQQQIQVAAQTEVSVVDIQPTGELYAWAVPSEEELEACARAWVSGGTLQADQAVEESTEQVLARQAWVRVHNCTFDISSLDSDAFPTNASFIVIDYRFPTEPLSSDKVLELLTFFSEHLSSSGCLVLVPSFG